jgi:hypothetical protein
MPKNDIGEKMLLVNKLHIESPNLVTGNKKCFIP